jgi:hypothetical protein
VFNIYLYKLYILLYSVVLWCILCGVLCRHLMIQISHSCSCALLCEHDTHNRALSDKWLPCCQKVYGQPHWIVVEDSTRACSYAVFLDMFREAMRLAGLEHEFDFQDSTRKWSLHAFRRGWVTNMRRNKFVVRVETIARHGNWSVNSVPVILSYADSTAAEHVQALKPSIVQALFG